MFSPSISVLCCPAFSLAKLLFQTELSDERFKEGEEPPGPTQQREDQPARPRTFINFVSAKQRVMDQSVASKARRRANDLKNMIELDTVYYDLFDLPPVREYDLYIRSFGRSNTKQVSPAAGCSLYVHSSPLLCKYVQTIREGHGSLCVHSSLLLCRPMFRSSRMLTVHFMFTLHHCCAGMFGPSRMLTVHFVLTSLNIMFALHHCCAGMFGPSRMLTVHFVFTLRRRCAGLC